MKICPQCATPYPDEAFAACPTCELIEASLHPAATAAVPDDGLKAELGALQAAVYGAPAADLLLAERPAEAAPLSFVPPPAGEPERPADEGEITFARLEALSRSGRMVIGLLGFPTAGKTWFLNRLKDNWEQPGNTTNPPKAPGGARVGATQDVAEHVFLKPGGGFYILDLPGERFEAAAQTGFRNDPILLAAINACGALAVILPADEALFSGRAASRYEAQGAGAAASDAPLDEAVAAAKARLAEADKELTRLRRRVKTDASETNIAALEAALAARDGAKAEHRELSARLMSDRGSGLAQAHQRLEAFIGGLGRVSGLLSLQASGAASGPLGPDEVDRHVMSDAFRPFPKPVCIALSKADCLLDEKGLAAELTAESPVDRVWRDGFDRDPLATIHHFRPTLARQFERWFRWVKFDFLTAFGGHRGGELINYDLESYGVNGIVEWMDWIARHDALPAKDQKILAQATALRRLRDQRPQDNGLTSLGDASGAARTAKARGAAPSQPQARAAVKAAIDFLFSKRSSWASLAVVGVAAALWLSTIAASTGLVPGAPPTAVKDETAQFILKAVTTTGSTLPPDVCAQSQNRERRLARAWAVRLSHSCPGPMNATMTWPLVIAFGWLGIPLTLGLNGVLTGALALALPRWLAVRRAYGKLYGSDHWTDSLADRALAAKARSQA